MTHKHITAELMNDLRKIDDTGLASSLGEDYGKMVLNYGLNCFTTEELRFHNLVFSRITGGIVNPDYSDIFSDKKKEPLLVLDDLEGLIFHAVSREIDGCVMCTQLYQAVIGRYRREGEEMAIELNESIENFEDGDYGDFLSGVIQKLKIPGKYDFLNLL
ncbi:MAG: hypothetical protein Q8Q01_03435 [archaeon]|nr:hypothetical protein [archaeon]